MGPSPPWELSYAQQPPVSQEGEVEQNCLTACPATISSTQGCSLLLQADKATEKASVPRPGLTVCFKWASAQSSQ
jgi:hypothetical protein